MWLVIGYGNSLHGDDGFGRLVADSLTEQNQNQEIAIISNQQLCPELAESISRAEGVIFVDASIDVPAGQVNCKKLRLKEREQSRCSSYTHFYLPETLMQTTGAIYGYAPPAWLYTVGGRKFGLGETASPEIKKLVPKVIKLILSRIRAARMQSSIKRDSNFSLGRHYGAAKLGNVRR